MRIWNMLAAAIVAAVALVVTMSAQATTILNGTLSSPGFYNGSGNPSNNFTIDHELAGPQGYVQLGLRARFRGGPNVIPVLDQYNLPTGIHSPGPPPRALWNYDWSVDLDTSGLHIPDVLTHVHLMISSFVTGASATINPLLYWGDNASYDNTDAVHIYQNGTGAAHLPDLLGVQNSQNLGFAGAPLPGFDPLREDLYTFTMWIDNIPNLSVTMDVCVTNGNTGDCDDLVRVSEPAALALLLAPMLGLGWLVRRRPTGASQEA